MSLLDTLRDVFSFGADEPQEDGDFRCIRCGAYHDREYDTCPDCGGQFVVPVEESEEPNA